MSTVTKEIDSPWFCAPEIPLIVGGAGILSLTLAE